MGGNARVTIAKHVDFGLHALYGNGVGRYGASTLPDATANANGTLAPLRSYQGLATLEWHSPKLDVYLNGGEEYVGRHYQVDTAKTKLQIGGVRSAGLYRLELLYRNRALSKQRLSLSDRLPAAAIPKARSRARSGSGSVYTTAPREEYNSARSIPTWSETHGTAPGL